ncbi:BlaI/MecI/CopY family transcriptional regulator [candidate division KSB1 bacterium]|nr:BlaI/MecI/CopY family transcriptional regulator [candidate division KSB1 bacterium]
MKKITAVEWEIMEAIWSFDKAPAVREVLDKAFPNGEKAYTTVQTIMNNLVKKGLLNTKKIGLVNFYTPLLSRKEMVQTEVTSVVRKIFHGSVPALANFLISQKDIDLAEIKQIKSILDHKEKRLRGKK